MSQNVKKESCLQCGKEVTLTHHTLGGISPAGKPSILCHQEPVEQPDNLLKFVLDARATKREALAEIERLKKQAVLDEQAITNEIQRKFDAKVKVEVDKQVKEDCAELSTNFKKIIEDGERTRVQLDASHQAYVRTQESLVSEISTQRDQLIVEKADVSDKLADRDQRVIDLHMEIEDLKEDLRTERHHHDGLKAKTKDMLHLAFTLGKRVVDLERELGINDEVAIEELWNKVTGQRVPAVVEEAARTMTDTPAPVAGPPPVRKAPEIVRDVPMQAAALHLVAEPKPPLPQAVLVELDDPTPEPESTASADDEDDGHDHGIDDDDVDQQEVPSDEDDDESSENDEPETCTFCSKAARQELNFTLVDGDGESDARLLACDPDAHGDKFWKYLKQNAKSAPKSTNDVSILFNRIL